METVPELLLSFGEIGREKTDCFKKVKRYDKLKTPYQRVLESPEISLETKLQLEEQYKKPFDLRKALEEKLKKHFKT